MPRTYLTCRCGNQCVRLPCSDCRFADSKRSTARVRQSSHHRHATADELARLAARAECGLPLVPDRRDRDEPRRLAVGAMTTHGRAG